MLKMGVLTALHVIRVTSGIGVPPPIQKMPSSGYQVLSVTEKTEDLELSASKALKFARVRDLVLYAKLSVMLHWQETPDMVGRLHHTK